MNSSGEETPKKRYLIECYQLRKRCARGIDLFKGANFQVFEREFVLLIGANGTGKSTFLRLLLGLEPPDEGHVLINGRNLQRLKRSEIPCLRRRMGVVFQDLKLMLHRSVHENVALPLQVLGKDRLFVRKKVQRVLHALELDRMTACNCVHLSQAERTMVAIARAVVHDPVILLLDEPAANLDQVSSATVFDLIKDVHARGATVILATQEPSMAARVPESRVAMIQEGRIIDKSRFSGAAALMR